MTRFLSVLLLFLGTNAARADRPEHPHHPPPPPSFAGFAQALELTEAQREPVRRLLAEQREKLHSFDFNTQKQREDLHESNRNELAKLLSETQLQHFDGITSRRRDEAGPARGPRPRSEHGGRGEPRAGGRARAD